MNSIRRRVFFKRLGAAGAGAAAVWAALVPESMGQTLGGSTTSPPAANILGDPVELPLARFEQMLTAATSGPEATILLNRVGAPVAVATPSGDSRQTFGAYTVDSITLPFLNQVTTAVEAVVIQSTLVATVGAHAGRSVSFAVAVYPDRTAHLAIEGRSVRIDFVPEYEQVLCEAFFPTLPGSFNLVDAGARLARVADIDVDGTPRPGNPPGLVHCRPHCSNPCGAWPGMMAGCIAVLAGMGILWWLTAGSAAVLGAALGATGAALAVCSAARGWYWNCQNCWEMCRTKNRKKWNEWLQQQQIPKPGAA